MLSKIDIKENDILKKYHEVLDVLLIDRTTKKNIIWATNNYENLGRKFSYLNQISVELITGNNGEVIMPRIKKEIVLQQSRIRDMAEVFTPSWICNSQNNLLDESWFNRKNVFNKSTLNSEGIGWKTNKNKIKFSKSKSWKDYIKRNYLEITCGEAPYITSRYDTTTGDYIELEDRIGILDRKLRVVNENTEDTSEWLDYAKIALKSTYGYEWQGDNLLLARESVLYTFIENFEYKFSNTPSLKIIREVALIISWNFWQMDGLKGVVPNSCKIKKIKSQNLFGEETISHELCGGCLSDDILKHTGKYCKIMDWKQDENIEIRYVDLIQN